MMKYIYSAVIFTLSLTGGRIAAGQQTCVWGAAATSRCYPGGKCGRGYICDTSRNLCCLPPAPPPPAKTAGAKGTKDAAAKGQ